jgi:peptidoglycan hydrolase-like protein with peptidoglycan-binding domain
MNVPDKILNSFSTKETLNPKFWTNPIDPEKSKMIDRVKKRLLAIANQFEEFIGLEMIIEDIQMTGSLSNFNWSSFSDVDIHLIVNFTQFPEKQIDLYKELFTLKKTLFNYDHDIKIFGYDVELYVQDKEEEHSSTGIYSLKNDKWVTIPKREFPSIDKDTLKKKIDTWITKIDETIEQAQEEKELKKSLNYLNKLKDKIKNYRKLGLTEEGEYSYENLVFKYLRRNGYIEKLFKSKNKIIDDKLTMKERQMFEQQEKNKTFGDKLLNLFGTVSSDGQVSTEKQKKEDDPKKADYISSVKDLMRTLEKISNPIRQQNRGDYYYQKDIEAIQTSLKLLGYELPKYGIDGKFGPETAKAVEKFKKDNQITESYLNKIILKVLNEYKENLSEASFEFNPSGNYSDLTFGLPSGEIGTPKVSSGGVSGDWDGSRPRALAFAKVANDFMGRNIISSQKRKNKLTASGNVSDHFRGSESAYAVDLSANGKQGDELLTHLMDWFGHPEYKGGKWFNVTKNGYRYQIGWRVPNHYDHIHVGVKKL